MNRSEHSRHDNFFFYFFKLFNEFFLFFFFTEGGPVSATEDSNTIGNEELKALEALMLRLSKQGIALISF